MPPPTHCHNRVVGSAYNTVDSTQFLAGRLSNLIGGGMPPPYIGMQNNKKPRGIAASGTNKNPRYHPDYLPIGDPFRLQQALSLNAGTRENLRHASSLRLGSDGFYGSWLPPRTNRQLSGNTQTEPSSSQPFYHCQQCIMSAPKSQMFFLSETLFSFCTKNPCGNPLKNGKTAC